MYYVLRYHSFSLQEFAVKNVPARDIDETNSICAQAMRVVRLFRLMKLFKHVEGRSNDSAKPTRQSRMSVLSPGVQQSRVGQKLSELTTRRVVLGVLTMVFVLPYGDVMNGVYGESPSYDQAGLRSLHSQALVNADDPVFLQGLQVKFLRDIYTYIRDKPID
jgi:hypothetical protein